jgi:hypothetical protein
MNISWAFWLNYSTTFLAIAFHVFIKGSVIGQLRGPTPPGGVHERPTTRALTKMPVNFWPSPAFF